jgi:hypothetical protein
MESILASILSYILLSISVIYLLSYYFNPFKSSSSSSSSKLIKIKGYPLIGNLLQLLPKNILNNLQKFKHIYGNLYELRLFKKRVIVISDKMIVNEILSKRPKIFRRLNSLDYVAKSIHVENGLFHANGNNFYLIFLLIC